MSKVPIIRDAQAFVQAQPHVDKRSRFLCLYSSWVNAIVTDPALMLIPLDDQIVHRGDGVFESFKSVSRQIYMLEPHLDRLESSMDQLHLKLPCTRERLIDLIKQVGQVADSDNILFRLYISRGPGGFSGNPLDSVGQQIYIVAQQSAGVLKEKHEKGVSAKISHVPRKDQWIAEIKTCNYISNVLMKEEAKLNNVDFTIGVSANGHVGEGATENIAIITKDNEFVYPPFDGVLRGTTLLRTIELLEQNQKALGLPVPRQRHITVQELAEAREICLLGTTLDLMPVVQFDGKAVGEGVPGEQCKKIIELILNDQKQGPFLTSY